MNYSVNISGKTVDVSMTPAAIRVLSRHNISVQVVGSYILVALFESGLISEKLLPPLQESWFRPVMIRHCGKDYSGDEPPLTDFPVENATAFVPKEVED